MAASGFSSPAANPGAEGLFRVKVLTNKIRENGDKIKIAEALEGIANSGNILGATVSSVQTQIASGSGITLAQVLAYLLGLGFARSIVFTLSPLASGANTVNPTAPLYEGDRLAIRVQQNGSGNGTVTFGANVKWCDANYVTNTASLWTVWNTVSMQDPTDSNNLKWFGVAPANAEQTL